MKKYIITCCIVCVIALYSAYFLYSFQNFLLVYQYVVYQPDILSSMSNPNNPKSGKKMDKQKIREGKARSEGTRPVLSRIYFIDRQIASGKYPSTKQLADEYEVGTATISRDIEFLRDMMGAPIQYDAQHRGYYYSDKSFRLPAAFSRAEDMLALGMAKSLLSLYRNTPLFSAARNLLDSITAPLDKAPLAGQKKWYETRIVVPQPALAPVADELWDILTAGLRENRVVGFEYTGTWDEEPQPRRVQPYQLLFDNGVWYLYGFSEERQAVRMFSLARMKNPALMADTFALPENYDYRTAVDGSYFGVFIGQEKRRFRITFYEESVAWVKSRQWAEDMTVEDAERVVIVDFSSTQYDKVFAWVLSQGCDALPFEPAELVEAWQDNVRKMAEKFSSIGLKPLD